MSRRWRRHSVFSQSARRPNCDTDTKVVTVGDQRERCEEQNPRLSQPLLVPQEINVRNGLCDASGLRVCKKVSGSNLSGGFVKTESVEQGTLSFSCGGTLPVFCSPQYRWSPLHTSYTNAIVEEHDAIVRWCEKRMRGKRRDGDEWIDERVLAVVKRRCEALEGFIKEHRELYGSFDADNLCQVEQCQRQLQDCVSKAKLCRDSRLPTCSMIPLHVDVPRTSACTFSTPAKHISFAVPLFTFVSSCVTPTKCAEVVRDDLNGQGSSCFLSPPPPAAEKEEKCGDEFYSARTSGVYYGNDFQLQKTCLIGDDLLFNHNNNANVLGLSNALFLSQQRSDQINTVAADAKKNDVFLEDAVFSPNFSCDVSAAAVLKKRFQEKKEARYFYRHVLFACSVLLFMIACWWRWLR